MSSSPGSYAQGADRYQTKRDEALKTGPFSFPIQKPTQTLPHPVGISSAPSGTYYGVAGSNIYSSSLNSTLPYNLPKQQTSPYGSLLQDPFTHSQANHYQPLLPSSLPGQHMSFSQDLFMSQALTQQLSSVQTQNQSQSPNQNPNQNLYQNQNQHQAQAQNSNFVLQDHKLLSASNYLQLPAQIPHLSREHSSPQTSTTLPSVLQTPLKLLLHLSATNNGAITDKDGLAMRQPNARKSTFNRPQNEQFLYFKDLALFKGKLPADSKLQDKLFIHAKHFKLAKDNSQPREKIEFNSPVSQGDQEKPFICTHPGCTWAFARQSDLHRHAKSHNKPMFHCPYWRSDPTCHRKGGSFSRLDILKRHLRLMHYVKDKQNDIQGVDPGWCRACQKMFTSSKDFIDHCVECANAITPAEWRTTNTSKTEND